MCETGIFQKFFLSFDGILTSLRYRMEGADRGLETITMEVAMTKRATNILIVGFAASGILVGTALTAAADGGRKGGHWNKGHHGGWGMMADPISFEQLDADGNGEISKEEFDARHSAWIKAVDANGDGMLQKEELEAHVMDQVQAMVEKKSELMFNRLDSDGDGAVSDVELQEKMGKSRNDDRMFNRLDSDDSGSVSAEEFESALSKMDGWRDGRNKDRKDKNR